MKAALAILVLLAAPALAHAQCGASHSSCPQAAATGTELCPADLTPVIESAARNALGSGAPTYRQIHNGCNNPNPPVLVNATLPCVLMKAVAQVESGWQQFCASCGSPGSTLISFDCGYGFMQVTSGMGGGAGFDPAQVAASSGYNVGTGAKILLDKWAATPCVGDNNPDVAEDWYMALWAYNGFGWVNNPNNPNFPASRPPYRGPGSLSRSNYPYQEIVLGYAAYPPLDNGTPRWTGMSITLPDRSTICNTQGCTVQDIPDPTPIHCDECQRGNAVSVVGSASASLQLGPGAQANVTFQLHNDGVATWDPARYAVVKQGGADLGAASIALPASVAPGGTASVDVAITAPAGGSQSETWALTDPPCAFGPSLTVNVTVIDAGAAGTDADHDGHLAGADDCDDSDPTVYRGAPEVCDGKDNDCNGFIDDAPDGGPLTRPCPGGTQRCAGGVWQACELAPSAEVCNGVDDDHNGKIDDGAPCPAGQECQGGVCKAELVRGCGCASATEGAPLVLLALLLRRRYGTATRT